VLRQGVVTSSGVERIAGAEVEGGIRRANRVGDRRGLRPSRRARSMAARVETVLERVLAGTAPPAT
jgi:hypothetical protein